MSLSKATQGLVLRNPLIRRYRCALFRPSHFWIYLTIYGSVVVLLLFINSSAREISGESILDSAFYRRLYYQFLAMQAVILWVWATLNSGSALRDEVANRTYDFFRLLPLSALQKGCGILLGRNLRTLLFAAVTFVPVILFGSLGGASFALQVQVVLVLFSMALFTNSAVLLSSSTVPRKQGNTSLTVWILAIILLGPFLLPLLFSSSEAISQVHEAEKSFVAFYSLQIPALPLVTLVSLYFGIWNVLGIVRKFTFETEPLFSRKAAVLFLIGYEFIALGLFGPHLPSREGLVYFYWLIVSMVPVALIPVGALKRFDGYLECCGSLRADPNSPRKRMFSTLLLHSNLTLAVGLFVIWVVFAAFAGLMNRIGASELAPNFVVIASHYLFLVLLLELYVVYEPLYSKIHVLLVFIAVVYLFVPIILSCVLERPPLLLYSPFGFLACLLDPSEQSGMAVLSSVLAVNGLLCIGPALLIQRRYAHILALRRAM